jgi:hypothetical protein
MSGKVAMVAARRAIDRGDAQLDGRREAHHDARPAQRAS